ncbi:hypothetical protein PSGE105469_00315 [Pseudomonas gessardii]
MGDTRPLTAIDPTIDSPCGRTNADQQEKPNGSKESFHFDLSLLL